ncbi:transporter substrate-binding domain-containing protein, partial [Burkholderia gladioli]|nr:transporter substrate-binding domain-containing protein [Burkholderia gladioli]
MAGDAVAGARQVFAARDQGRVGIAGVGWGMIVMVDTSFDRFADDLLADRCDVAMLAVAATAARREMLRFSRPYLSSGIVGVASRGSEVVRGWG